MHQCRAIVRVKLFKIVMCEPSTKSRMARHFVLCFFHHDGKLKRALDPLLAAAMHFIECRAIALRQHIQRVGVFGNCYQAAAVSSENRKLQWRSV